MSNKIKKVFHPAWPYSLRQSFYIYLSKITAEKTTTEVMVLVFRIQGSTHKNTSFIISWLIFSMNKCLFCFIQSSKVQCFIILNQIIIWQGEYIYNANSNSFGCHLNHWQHKVQKDNTSDSCI